MTAPLIPTPAPWIDNTGTVPEGVDADTVIEVEAPSLADYYTEFAAQQKARNDAEQAAYLAYRDAQSRLPVSQRDTIDPSANGCGQRLNPYQFNAMREF